MFLGSRDSRLDGLPTKISPSCSATSGSPLSASWPAWPSATPRNWSAGTGPRCSIEPDASAHLIVVGEEDFPLGRDRGPGRLVRRGHAAAGRAGSDRGHHRNPTLAAAGAGRSGAGHPSALHAGHAGRVAGRAGGGDSPLAPAGTDRAGPRGAAAAVLRFPGSGHGAAAGRAAGGGRLAAGDRKAARVAGPLSCPASPGRWPSFR